MQAAFQIEEHRKGIQLLIHEIDEARMNSENTILKINSKNSALKGLLKLAINDANKEEQLVREALTKIHKIRIIRNESRIQARNAGNKETIRRSDLYRMLAQAASTLPLFVSKPGEKTPPLCGAIPADNTYTGKPGDMVAALAKMDHNEENWILAEVVMFVHHNQKYEIHDIDDEIKPRHILSKRRIIPLPLMRINPETDSHALFTSDTFVMALYPQTTCFYKAIIHSQPQTAQDDYYVLFEDSSFSSGYSDPTKCAQRYVISMKHGKKSNL